MFASKKIAGSQNESKEEAKEHMMARFSKKGGKRKHGKRSSKRS
jgi:hypothetical protein